MNNSHLFYPLLKLHTLLRINQHFARQIIPSIYKSRKAIRNQTIWLITLSVCSWITNPSFAEEYFNIFVPVRPMGMGNAGTALADDHNSLWNNPAGIGRLRKARTRKNLHLIIFPNIVGGANSEGQAFYSKLQTSTDSGTLAQNISTALEANGNSSSEQPIWARLSANPVVFFEGGKQTPMAFSLFTASTAKLIFITDSNEPTAQVSSVTDIGGTLTYSLTNRTNRFNVGLQIRPMTRYAFDDKLDLITLTDKKTMEDRVKSDSNVGSAVAVDFGMIWTFADFWFPTFGLAVFNVPTGCRENYLNPFTETRQTICGTVFSGSINNPESLYLVEPTDMRVGLSMTPRLFNKMALRIGIDMHHIYAANGETYYGLPGSEPIKQTHAGVELFFGNPLKLSPFSLRAGVNQGFVTTGATIRISFLTLELATYGKDISSDSSQTKDQRTVFSLSGEF